MSTSSPSSSVRYERQVSAPVEAKLSPKQIPVLRKIARKAMDGYSTVMNAKAGLLAPKTDALYDINRFHGIRLLQMEGYMRSDQAAWFQKLLTHKPSVKNILEIGFNGGHSSFAFLNSRPDTRVLSFDLGEHEYVTNSQLFIDKSFPARHTLVRGDSRQTLPDFADQRSDYKADLIFIDGGHGYSEARSDLQNTRQFAHKDSILVMDDYMSHVPWGQGPVAVWDDMVRSGEILQEQIVSGEGRAWAVGRYIGLSSVVR